MTQFKTTAWQYLHCPEAYFATHGKDLFIHLFLTFKRKLWEVVPNHEIWVWRGMTSLRQAMGNDMKKYSLHQSVLTHWLAIETFFKIVGSWLKNPKWRSYQYISLQTRSHIMTINRHNNITRFLPPTDQKYADCRSWSTYRKLFYYRPPGKFLRRWLKVWRQ